MKKPNAKKNQTRRREQSRKHLEWVKERTKVVQAWQQNTLDGKPAELVPAPDGSRVLVVEEPAT